MNRDREGVPDDMVMDAAVNRAAYAGPAERLADDDEALALQAVVSRAAFAELYRRHADRVYRYCLGRTGSVHDAQEITSDTFLGALEGVRSYRSGHFGAWLIGIARNKAALFYRRRRETVGLDETAADWRPQAAVEHLVGQRIQMEKVAGALRAIAPDRAEALSLRILGELPTSEVARLMGKSEAAVRMLIHRAIADLRGRLDAPGENVR